MKITVINGTDRHGLTWNMKNAFLRGFDGDVDISEFSVPSDGPGFCTGCVRCISAGEQLCPHARATAPIAKALEEADLIVITSPVYVFHATGAVKNLLDHLAYRWMPHRPSPAMFSKRAVIITQCAGMGTRTAVRDLRDSLAWWGISDIRAVTARTGAAYADKQAMDRILHKCRIAGQKTRRRMRKAPCVSVATRARFSICRLLQKKLSKDYPESVDGAYWTEQGWLEEGRPWRQNRGFSAVT